MEAINRTLPHCTICSSACWSSSYQASDPVVISSRVDRSPDEEEGTPVTSPGLQWLQYLGVAGNQAKPKDVHLSKMPSAKAWLSRKSRQFLGLSLQEERQDTEHLSRIYPSHKGAERDPSSMQARALQPDPTSTASEDVTSTSAYRPEPFRDAEAADEESATCSPLLQLDARAPFKRLSSSKSAQKMEEERYVGPEMLGTVFSEPQAEAKPRPAEAKGSHLKASRRLGSKGRRQHSRGARIRFPAESDARTSASEGSSNEETSLARKADQPASARHDLLEGSMSLAYSEHDQSSDTELTDGSGGPISAIPKVVGSAALKPEDLKEGKVPSMCFTPKHDHRAERTLGNAEVLVGREAIAEERTANSQAASRGPIFVPIVMRMANEDQIRLVDQRYSRNTVWSFSYPWLRH